MVVFVFFSLFPVANTQEYLHPWYASGFGKKTSGLDAWGKLPGCDSQIFITSFTLYKKADQFITKLDEQVSCGVTMRSKVGHNEDMLMACWVFATSKRVMFWV